MMRQSPPAFLSLQHPEIGQRAMRLSSVALLEGGDADTLADGEEVTLKNWGNVKVKKIDRDAGGESVHSSTAVVVDSSCWGEGGPHENLTAAAFRFRCSSLFYFFVVHALYSLFNFVAPRGVGWWMVFHASFGMYFANCGRFLPSITEAQVGSRALENNCRPTAVAVR